MGQPIDKAFVEIEADDSRFGPELKDAIDDALKSVEKAVSTALRRVEKAMQRAGQVSGEALEDGIVKGARDAGDALTDELDVAVRGATDELTGLGEAGDRELDAIGRAAEQAGEEIGDGFEAGSRDARVSLERLDRKIAEVESSIAELNREFARTGDTDLFAKIAKDRSLLAQMRRVRSELDDVADAVDGVGDNFTREFRKVDSSLDRTARRIRNLATVGISARSALIGGLVVGAAAATPGLIGLAGAVLSASGAAALLPAAYGAAAAAVGTLQLATAGLEDAMKAVAEDDAAKLQEALEGLAPAAQTFVKEIAGVKPEFDKMRLGVQGELFDGLGKHVSKLAELYLPLLSEQLGGIAAHFNDAANSVAGFLSSSEAVSDVNVILSNSKTAIGELTDAIAPLTEALLGVGVVGSTFLPGIAEAAGNAAERFATWVDEARESGELEDIISSALDVLKQLGALAADVGGILKGIFTAAEGTGSGALGFLGTLADTLNDVVNSAGGQAGLSAVFSGLSQIASALGPVLGSVAGALAPLTGVVAPLLTALGPGLTALIDGLAGGLEALAPAAEPVGQAISAVAKAIAPILPLAGELLGALLPPLAEILTAVAEAAAPLIKIFVSFAKDALAQLEPHLPVIVKLISQVASILGDALAQILPIILGLWMDLSSAIMPLIPIVLQLVEALLPLLPPILELVSALLQPLAALLSAILPPVLKLITPILQLATLIVTWLIEKAIVPLVEFISGFLVGILEALVGDFDAVGSALQTVGGWFVWLWANAIKPAFEFISMLVTAWWETTKAIWDAVMVALQTLGGWFMWLWVQIQVAFVAIMAKINGFWVLVKTIFAKVVEWVKARIGDFVAGANRIREFVNKVRNFFNQMVQAVRDKISSAVSTVKGLPGKIKSAIGNLGKLLYNAGRRVIQGLIDGIKSMIGSVGSSMSNIADKIKQYLPFSPAELGPLAGSGDPTISGQHIAQMIADGIRSQVTAVQAATAELAAAARLDTLTTAGAGTLAAETADRISAMTRGGDGASITGGGADGELVATAVIDLGEGIERVVDVKFRRRSRDLRRRVKAGTGKTL